MKVNRDVYACITLGGVISDLRQLCPKGSGFLRKLGLGLGFGQLSVWEWHVIGPTGSRLGWLEEVVDWVSESYGDGM